MEDVNTEKAYALLLPFIDRLAKNADDRRVLRETCLDYMQHYIREPDVPIEVVLGLAVAHQGVMRAGAAASETNWLDVAIEEGILEASIALASLHGSWWHIVVGKVLFWMGRLPTRPRFAGEYYTMLSKYRIILMNPWAGY